MQKIHGSLVTKYSFNYGIALPTDLFLNGWPYTDYTLDHKTNLDKFKRSEIIPRMFSVHDGI